MAQSFDILNGQYLAMIAHLREAFTARSTDMVAVTLTGTVKDKPKSITVQIQTSNPYYLLHIGDYRLHGGQESYTNMPSMRIFSLGHVHSALALTGQPKNDEDKRALRSLILLTSEAARFEPFAIHINTLIADGDGARVLNYAGMMFYINDWRNMFEWTHGEGAAFFKPLTEANMHNWHYHHHLIVRKAGGNMNRPFSQTQDSLRPKSIADL